MWVVEPIPFWKQEYSRFSKKYPTEAEAVMANLLRFEKLLNSAPNSRCIQAGFLHTEGRGVLALDQKGQGKNLRETRLYLYADDAEKVIYLITIGNKSSQTRDIAVAHDFVELNFGKSEKKKN